MKVHKWKDIKNGRMSPAQIANSDRQIATEVLDLRLAELRERLGKTQKEIADLAMMNQGDLSVAERRNDHLVSSLRRIVEGMGGELRVVAVFGDEQINLKDV